MEFLKLKDDRDRERDNSQSISSSDQKNNLSLLDINNAISNYPSLLKSGHISIAGWTAGLLYLIYWLPQLIIINYVWGKACINSGVVTPYPLKPDDITNLVIVMCAGGLHSLFKGKD